MSSFSGGNASLQPYCEAGNGSNIAYMCDVGGNGGAGGGYTGGSTGISNAIHGAGGGGGSSFAAALGQAQEATAAGNGVTPANANLIPASAPASNNAKGGASAQAGSSGLVVISW